MDAKITLSFNKVIIDKAKEYADENNMSLSRLIEFLLMKITSHPYTSFEDYPISEWVIMVSEGQAEYRTKRTRKEAKAEYFKSKK